MKLGYRPDIDGLRAIAVLAVILFHAGWGMPGGYVGVDVFFVISGFLITSLVVADIDQRSFSLARFWERRIRRIWPASLVVTLTVLAAGGVVMLPLDYRVLAGDAVAQALMLANVRFWPAGDYSGDALELRPLLHMWSLAVEEQFYLLFPLLLVGARSWGWSWRLGVLAAVAAASFAASVLLLEKWPQAVFFLLPYRGWELLVGGLVALLPATWLPRRGWSRNLGALIGLALIFVPCWWYDRRTPFPAAAAVPPCLGAALLIVAGSGAGAALPAVSRLVGTPPLVAIGRMSYSLYLWHWPVLAFLRYGFGAKLPQPVTAAALAAVALLSYASWRWVEQPFRRSAEPVGATHPTPWKTIWIAAATCGVVIAVSMLIRVQQGLPSRFNAEQMGFGQTEKYSVAMVHRGMPADDGTWHFPSVGTSTAGRPCFLLWGDSQALAISESLDRRARELGIGGVAAIMYATVPVPGAWTPRGFSLGANSPAKAERWSGAVIDWIRSRRPRHVILCVE